MIEKKCDLQFAVLGLGRFGMSILRTLAEYDVNVLACDKDPALLHSATEYATQVVQADVSDEEAMANLGLGNFDVVVLAMGEDFESAIMATMTAKELGAGKIVVKALGPKQKKILESIGADLVVLPEMEMGEKIARRLVNPNILDVLENAGHFTITEMHPLAEWVGKSIATSDIRRKYGTLILAVIRGAETTFPVPADFVPQADDVMLALDMKA